MDATLPDNDWKRMLDAARSIQGARRLSGYVEAGSVAAAVLTGSGCIYTGVCVDTCCTLGICAERNALFAMITGGESDVRRVLAVGAHGRIVPPCGACREFLVQLMPKTYRDIEILLSYPDYRSARLGELTPDWWI